MRNRNTQGFTLIELLIVIAIIGILAAVLIPNLLNARSRAFDTAAQTCLREISTQEEVIASDDPFLYNSNLTDADLPAGSSCSNAAVQLQDVGATALVGGEPAATTFTYEAYHDSGNSVYTVSAGSGVTRARDLPDPPAF